MPGSGDFWRGGGAREGLAGFAACRRGFRDDRHLISIIGGGAEKEKPRKRWRRTVAATRGEMIVGLGVDIAEVERVRGAIERQGERFLKRVYTEKERAYCEQFKNKYERYAGRFAVKEATMKALGTGWSRGVRWADIEVVRERGGKPTLELHGEA